MEGMANLADVMLVFACGLILALIINWNVDVTTISTTQEPIKYEIDGIDENAEKTLDGAENLEEMGKVYLDQDTGKYYVIEGE